MTQLKIEVGALILPDKLLLWTVALGIMMG